MGLPVYQELRVSLVAAFVENTGFLEGAALATTLLLVIILLTYVCISILSCCVALPQSEAVGIISITILLTRWC